MHTTHTRLHIPPHTHPTCRHWLTHAYNMHTPPHIHLTRRHPPAHTWMHLHTHTPAVLTVRSTPGVTETWEYSRKSGKDTFPQVLLFLSTALSLKEPFIRYWKGRWATNHIFYKLTGLLCPICGGLGRGFSSLFLWKKGLRDQEHVLLTCFPWSLQAGYHLAES